MTASYFLTLLFLLKTASMSLLSRNRGVFNLFTIRVIALLSRFDNASRKHLGFSIHNFSITSLKYSINSTPVLSISMSFRKATVSLVDWQLTAFFSASASNGKSCLMAIRQYLLNYFFRYKSLLSASEFLQQLNKKKNENNEINSIIMFLFIINYS